MRKFTSKIWGVLGKQKEYYQQGKFQADKRIVPLNANPLEAWDTKNSRYRRVDLIPREVPPNVQQMDGINESSNQSTAVPVASPTQTPSNTPSPTPSVTPTFTPTQTNTPTPSSTPYPLPLNPTIWYDSSDSSTLTLINSGGTNYVSAWQSKGTNTWTLSGANTDTMPVLSASTLMPGNPNIVRFTSTTGATTFREYLSSFNNTPIGHTGSTIFQVFSKPSGSTYTTSPSFIRVYSGLTNGAIAINNPTQQLAMDSQLVNITNNIQAQQIYATIPSGFSATNLSVPAYSAAALNDKFIFQVRTPLTAGQFQTYELNQSAGTWTTAFTGTTTTPQINSFTIGVSNITTGGTISLTNMNSELAEVMYFDSVLTNSQIEQVELYLKDKWRYDEWASPVPTPTQTASPTTTPTPSITPTNTNTPTPSATPPPFSPLSLSPAIWVDFSDSATMSIRTSGGASFLQSINNKGTDLSITGFSQTTAANQPRIRVSTVFTGTSISAATISNDWITQTGITGNNWTTIIVMGRLGTAAASISANRFEWAGGNSSTIFWNLTNTITRQAIFSSSTTTYDFTDPGTKWSGQTYLQYFSSSALTTVEYAEVNGSGMTLSQSGADRINWPQSGTMFILNQNGATDDKQADMGEIIMLRRELTSTEKNNLNNYLRIKWGLTY